MSSQIDQVLQDAVAAGHVPNAVAVAADRNGVIYVPQEALDMYADFERGLYASL